MGALVTNLSTLDVYGWADVFSEGESTNYVLWGTSTHPHNTNLNLYVKVVDFVQFAGEGPNRLVVHPIQVAQDPEGQAT